MMSINIIKTKRLHQKYLTALLNSKLIEFWLRNKGKMQCSNFQIDKEPLLNLPLLQPVTKIQNKIAKIVTQIIATKQQNPTADTTDLEKEIDNLVYELYELTP